MSTIKVSIVSSSEEIYSGEGTMVFATGSLGEIGIAPGHTPLLTGLAPGPVRVQNGDDEQTFFCSGGFIEIQPDIVTFLSDRAERADSMDEAEAIKAQEQAEKNMHDQESTLDYTKAAAQLSRSSSKNQNHSKIKKKQVRYLYQL